MFHNRRNRKSPCPRSDHRARQYPPSPCPFCEESAGEGVCQPERRESGDGEMTYAELLWGELSLPLSFRLALLQECAALLDALIERRAAANDAPWGSFRTTSRGKRRSYPAWLLEEKGRRCRTRRRGSRWRRGAVGDGKGRERDVGSREVASEERRANEAALRSHGVQLIGISPFLVFVALICNCGSFSTTAVARPSSTCLSSQKTQSCLWRERS